MKSEIRNPNLRTCELSIPGGPEARNKTAQARAGNGLRPGFARRAGHAFKGRKNPLFADFGVPPAP
jgi:hypothetical protein